VKLCETCTRKKKKKYKIKISQAQIRDPITFLMKNPKS